MTKSLLPQRRMAAEILGVGIHRVWIDPEALDEVEKAVTKEDIKRLIKERKIWKRPIRGVSRHRAREREEKRRKGRRRGPGKRKGSKKARMGGSMVWVLRIRAIRKILRRLKNAGVISRRTYNKLRRLAKAGVFRSKAHVITYIKEHRLNLKPIESIEDLEKYEKEMAEQVQSK
ncbi:MAG: 50S ribosomal protein L19e [Candidatus Njordarchaeales archaeon]